MRDFALFLTLGATLCGTASASGGPGGGRPTANKPAAAAKVFACNVTRVHDGDGPIWCAEQGLDGKPIKIRLQAVAAREMPSEETLRGSDAKGAYGTCLPGHPCPRASAAAAKAELARLAVGQRLRCEATGSSYERVTAWCWTPAGVQLNCAMVKSGTTLRWARFDRDRRLCRP